MNLNEIKWEVKKFEELSLNELYEILNLRQEVFVVEQDCPYIDADFKDQKSLMINGYFEGKLVAHTRIIFPGISYAEASIGRVATHKDYRGTGLGQELMLKTIETLEKHFGYECRISAQCYLVNFYKNFGFEVCSEEYLEDNIPHIQMFKSKKLL